MNQQKRQDQKQEQEQAGQEHTPSKESVRTWLRREIAQHRPPPDPAQIRRELGWELIRGQNERKR